MAGGEQPTQHPDAGDRPRLAHEWYEYGYSLLSENRLDQARHAFEQAVSGTYGTMPPFSRAGALRALGQLADSQGDLAGAMHHYRAALALDGRVGVRKRLAALERRQASSETGRRRAREADRA